MKGNAVNQTQLPGRRRGRNRKVGVGEAKDANGKRARAADGAHGANVSVRDGEQIGARLQRAPLRAGGGTGVGNVGRHVTVCASSNGKEKDDNE